MNTAAPTNLLIDTDGGVDDALALVMALRSRAADLRAITTVAGNTGVDQATRNVRTVLQVVGSDEPILARGCDQPILGGRMDVPSIHGADGLGELARFTDDQGSPLYGAPDVTDVRADAVQVIINQARELGSELTVVAIGPLTNLALAARIDPEAMLGVGRIVIMGGAFRVPGNIAPAAEYNVWSDPEAAQVVLATLPQVEWIGLDVALRVPLLRSQVRDHAARARSRIATFAQHCTGYHMDFYLDAEDHDGCYLHDPLAVAVALDESLVEFEEIGVRVELASAPLRGMTSADVRARRGDYGHRTKVAVDVDVTRVMTEYVWPSLA